MTHRRFLSTKYASNKIALQNINYIVSTFHYFARSIALSALFKYKPVYARTNKLNEM